jgi:glycosyltransferase involved in cell wall biosynthesis
MVVVETLGGAFSAAARGADLVLAGALSSQLTARVSVVIPAKNEAANIGWVLERLPALVDEVVLVDGRSSDGTVEAARAVRPDIVFVSEMRPGKGAALRAGVEAATGSYVVILDADGSMDPLEIPYYLARLNEGHDLAKGSRFLPGAGTADMTQLRMVGNRGLLGLANALFRTAHTDLCYGFAAFRREAFLGLDLTADGFEIEAQLFLRAARKGLRVVEVSSFESERRAGNSNLNTFRDGWRVLRTILVERLRGWLPAWPSRRRTLPSVAETVSSFAMGVTTTRLSSATAAFLEATVHMPSRDGSASPVPIGIAPFPGVEHRDPESRVGRQGFAAGAAAGADGAHLE